MLFYTFLVSFLLFANALEFNLDAETIERQRTNEVCDEASVDNHRRLTNTCHLGVCKKYVLLLSLVRF